MMSVEEARSAFPGGWILPGDAEYDEARPTFNGTIDPEPPGGAAFGQRPAGWNISGIAIWEDPADDAEQIAWAAATPMPCCRPR